MSALLLFLFLRISVSSEDPDVIVVKDKDEHELIIESELVSKEYMLELPYAFKLIVDIEKVDLQSKYGDYLLIKRGPEMTTEGTGIVFTEKGITDKTLFISADVVYIKLFVGPTEGQNTRRKCKIKYRASGGAIMPTTETPATTVPWPTPGPKDIIHYKAYLYGLRDTDYKQTSNVDKLRIAISKMAAAYCRDQNMPVGQPITLKNVIIDDLIRCPYAWPESDKCVVVNFAVPVVVKGQYEGYELLAKHLEVMWQRYEKELLRHGFETYQIPDLDAELVIWDATFVVLLTLLILSIITIALIVICKPRCISPLFRSVKNTNDQQIIIKQEERDSYVPNESEYDKFKASARIS